MTSRLTVSRAVATALALATVPALAQVAPQQAEDARLRNAAAQRTASDPMWARLTQDNFGQSAWDALANPAVAKNLAVDPDYNRYGPNDLAKAPGKPTPSVQALLDKVVAAKVISAPQLRRATPAAGEAVTLTGRDLGNGITENRYYLSTMLQTFDGVFERSHSQKAGLARVRNGDESWVLIDFGDGAIVTRQPERFGITARLSGGQFVSTTPTEVAMAYDYRTHTLRGNPRAAAYHNTYIRPLMANAPALGGDVSWSVSLSAAKLGVSSAGSGDFPMQVKRTYISNAGTPYVIIEYTVPEFTYGNSFGEKVVHRARGVALADPAMGQIFWNTSLQTATATEKSGRTRPYRYARTSYAMDARGQPLIDLEQIPQMKRYMDEFYAPAATAPLPLVGLDDVADQAPLQMAARIDIAGFTLGENSANEMGEQLGTQLGGEGSNSAAAGTALDGLIQTYGIPDKLKTAFDGITDLEAFNRRFGPAVRTAEDFFAATNLTPADFEELGTLAEKIGAEGTKLKNQAKSLANQLKTLNTRIDDKRQIMSRLIGNAGILDDIIQSPEVPQLARQARALEQEAAAISQQIVAMDIAITKNALAVSRIQPVLKTLQTVQDGLAARGILGFASTVNKVLTKTKIGVGLSVLSNANNAESLYQVNNNLANWNPEQAGDLNLQGHYGSAGALVSDLTLNVMGMAGNLASGNLKSFVSDATSFSVGRLSDLFFAMEGAKAAEGQAEVAQKQYILTLMRSAKLSQAKINQYQAQVDDLGQRIQALDQEVNSRPTVRAQTDDWTDPRFDANGKPIPAYWAWLKVNNPDALRRMGIDPDAPVGGWPNGVRPQNQPAQPVAQPRQPSGPNYPTRDPSTVRRNNPDPEPASGPLDNNPGAVFDEMAAATTGRRPNNYVPPPRPPARDDHIYTDEDPLVVTFDPVTFDPETFDPPTYTPDTWEPPEWEPPTWEPPTWEPPTWTPPKFDAPKASEIEWTDLEVGKKWPKAIDNMAFQYDEMSGTVATDLSPWDAWLKTQNVYYLEQLAKTAGYPNLASALTDWASLIRKANDPKFYEWAWSPPAVSGAIGIGFSEGQHEMGRAAYLLGDLMKLSGLFGDPDDARASSGDGDFDDSSQSLRARNGLGGKGSGADLANSAYGGNYEVQHDASGRLGRESGGYLAASLFSYEDPYLRTLLANGRTGLDRLLAQPFNVVLTWGEHAYDLDLHMTGPLGGDSTDRFHIYFGAKGSLDSQPYAALIKDCICNSGSEVMLTTALNGGGVYRVSVFNYGDQSATSSNLSSASEAKIQIVRGGTTESVGNGTTIIGGHTILTTTVPAGGPGNTWTAVELDPKNGRITVPGNIRQSEGSGGVN